MFEKDITDPFLFRFKENEETEKNEVAKAKIGNPSTGGPMKK